MARRRKTEAEKWRIVGLRQAGLSQREIARRVGVTQSEVSRLLAKVRQTNSVQDRLRSGRPKKSNA